MTGWRQLVRGVVVSGTGDVLTSAAVLDAGSRATVTALGSGELAATVRLKEKDSGLGVLGVDGLQGTGLPLSVPALAAGARIFTVTTGSADEERTFIAGAAGEAVVRSTRNGEVRLLQHNAMTTVHGYGSAVIDECGRLVALNVPDPKAFTLFTAPHKAKPKNVMFALNAGDVASRLEPLGVGFASITDACASAEARAREQAQEAREAEEKAQQAQEEARQADEKAQQAQEEAQRAQEQTQSAREDTQEAQEAAQKAREKAQQAQVETERAQEDARQAQERARQAQAEAQRAAEQSAKARAREAEERQQSERLRRLALWGGTAGGVLLLLLLVSWMVSARRRRRAMRQAEARAADAEREAADAQRRMDEMPEPAPFDCVLTGVDKAGTAYAVNLRRETLGDPAGVTVGRNPAGSSHVVADPSVSREHARFYMDGGVLYVEDLGSTNGTTLNGRALVPGERVRVGGGEELMLGSVTFRIDLKS